METVNLPSSLNGGPKTKGVYAVRHRSTHCMLVGSTKDLFQRKQFHMNSLLAGTHPNASLQAAFDHDPDVEFLCVPTGTITTALYLEQCLMTEYADTGMLFNTATTAAPPVINPMVG